VKLDGLLLVMEDGPDLQVAFGDSESLFDFVKVMVPVRLWQVGQVVGEYLSV